MNNKNIYKEVQRLNFEDFLWLTFAILSLLNIYGDYDDKKYLKSGNNIYRIESNQIFTLTLVVTFFIYLYFFIRNYKNYEVSAENEKKLYSIKLLGSAFLIAGIICLLYFQTRQTSFIGSPAI